LFHIEQKYFYVGLKNYDYLKIIRIPNYVRELVKLLEEITGSCVSFVIEEASPGVILIQESYQEIGSPADITEEFLESLPGCETGSVTEEWITHMKRLLFP
jgi:hypothetical protein